MKKTIVTVLIFTIMLIMTSCYDSTEVDDLVYVLAIGVDKSKNNEFEFTFQSAVPLNISSGIETSFSSSDESVNLQNITVSADDLYQALNIANRKITKELDISHCELIIFSEQTAKDTLKPHIKSIINNPDLRPSLYVAISESNSKDYLGNISSPFELNPSRYYKLFFNKDYSAESFSANLKDFEKQNVVMLPLIDKNQEFKTSVVKNYKQIGTLDSRETIFLNILTGRFKSGYVKIPNSKTPINLSMSKKPKIIVETSTNNPKINIKIDLYGTPLSENDNKNEFDKNVINYIEKSCVNLLRKSSNELKSDILNISQNAKKNFYTTQSFKNYAWDSKYNQAKFSVTVNYKTIR